MFSAKTLQDSRIEKFLRSLSPGEFLFKEGEPGNTMFILIQGKVELVERRGVDQIVFATIKTGEVLGEKAILSETPYPRSFGVRATEASIFMEFSAKNFKVIETVIPDFALRILQITAQRLDRTTLLVKILRSTDESERFINTIMYLANFEGTQTSQGTEFIAAPEDFFRIANLPKEFTQSAIEFLVDKKVLLPTKNGFALTNEAMLRQVFQQMREQLAA